MALRLNTVEYAFPQRIAYDVSGAVQNFQQITIDIPETTNRTFISAFADIFTLDAGTAAASIRITEWGLGIRVGGSGEYLNASYAYTIGNTGENLSFHTIFDVSSQFINNFTGTSHAVDASFYINGIDSNNTSCKLVIAYQWDDIDQTRIKTVRIPIESSSNALGTSLANISGGPFYQIPALDYWLPEASKAYKDIFFESWVNENTVGASAPNPSLGFALDSESTSDDYAHEDALVSARLYRRIWQRKDMSTNIEHQFKAKTANANMSFRGLSAVLNVTYTFYEPDTTRVMNSIVLAAADEVGFPGGTTSNEMSRFKRTLSIVEENSILTRSGVLFSWIDALGSSVIWYVKINNQSNFRGYVIPTAALVVCGGLCFMQNFDASSLGGQGITLSKEGYFNIDWYTTTATTAGRTGTNFSALMYLNYTSDKSTLPGGSANNSHTVCTLLFSTVASFLRYKTVPLLVIPEINRWVAGICPTLRYDNNAAAGFVYLSAQLDSSTDTGAGWSDLYAGMMLADAEQGPQISFARARREFKRWPLDTDKDRMYIENPRMYKIGRSQTMPMACYTYISYHTITNYVSGKVSGYTGTGEGISIGVYDYKYLNEMIYEGSTGAGGQWGFTWYNPSTYCTVYAYQDSSYNGMTKGFCDTSLNIIFSSSTPSSTSTSWVF